MHACDGRSEQINVNMSEDKIVFLAMGEKKRERVNLAFRDKQGGDGLSCTDE